MAANKWADSSTIAYAVQRKEVDSSTAAGRINKLLLVANLVLNLGDDVCGGQTLYNRDNLHAASGGYYFGRAYYVLEVVIGRFY